MKKLKIVLLPVAMIVVGLTAGCVSYGGSYEKHYSNPLANGNEVIVGTNGQPQAVINGSESYEHHWSYDINPFKYIFGDWTRSSADNEVVAPAPAPYPQSFGQDQGLGSYQYQSRGDTTGYDQSTVILGYDAGYVPIYVGPGWDFQIGLGWYSYQGHRYYGRPASVIHYWSGTNRGFSHYGGGQQRSSGSGYGYPSRSYGQHSSGGGRVWGVWH